MYTPSSRCSTFLTNTSIRSNRKIMRAGVAPPLPAEPKAAEETEAPELTTTTPILGEVIGRSPTYKRVCYFTNWAQYRPDEGKFTPENIDPSLCTHIIYAFAIIKDKTMKPFEWNDDKTEYSEGM